ncbi:hypothetical protein [Qipengyuania spongiae]|uniref:Uncharacterized protein n=1 Tax=Qipengyuania spongiae TaxID=2909673 RepID=A0ABY5SZ56_9SPHN|nr:hypothetical protein [Qipengyuania spongiae]UVI38403.1 hypothetical protein L1F33_09025 [Qipengyuania spongiae]
MSADDRRWRMFRSRRELRRRSVLAHAARTLTGYSGDLVVIVVVDAGSKCGARGSFVSCFGALQVSIVDGDPVFTKHHEATVRKEERPCVMDRLAALCSGRDVVLGSADPYVSFADRRHLLHSGIGFVETVGRFAGGPPSGLDLFTAPEGTMAALAAGFALACCHRREPIDQARCAAVRAQLTWIAYVRAVMGRRRAEGVLAAYRAWALIEKCRPVRF